MVERFFSIPKKQSESHHNENPLMLVSGPRSSGKTSLVFQFALNSVLDNHAYANGFVIFICNRRNLETNPPFLSQDIDPSSHIFQRIHMKYIDDYQGINKYFAAFHLHDTFPCAVVIDDFADFFDDRSCKERYGNNPRAKEVAMVRTLGLCHNAIMHANAKTPCKLVLSDTHHNHGDSPRLLFIYKRWVSTVFTIAGDGCGSFTLKCNNDSEENGRSVAKYSTALQYLFLEGITLL